MAEFDKESGLVKMGAGAATGAAAGSVIPGIGTAIGAGVGALGGLLGGFISNEYNEAQQEKALAFQREAAQNSIQWRVADAKKAGLHPLYALGASPSMMTPITVSDSIGPALREASQDIGGAVTRSLTQKDKLLEALQLDMLMSDARRKKSEAGIAFEQEVAARRANNESDQSGLGIHNERDKVNPMGQVPAVRGTEVPGAAIGAAEEGYYQVAPSKYTSGSYAAKGWEARGKEGMQEWRLRDGFYVSMPYSDEGIGEQLHEMSPREKIVMILQNGKIYGEGYVADAINYFFAGIEPKGKYKSVTEQGVKPEHPSGRRGRELLK